jgi:MFS family permease
MTVWETLLSKQMVAGEKPTLELASPWYIKLLLSLSGWFGALFLVIFTGGTLVLMFGVSIDRYPGILGLIGAGLVFFAYTMFKEKQSDFLEHFILALSIAGQAMIMFSLFYILRGNMQQSVYLIMALFQAFLMWFVPNYMHRMLSSFFMALTFAFFFYQAGEPFVPMLLFTFVVAWLWMNEFSLIESKKVEAIAYGQTAALIWLKYSFLTIPYTFYGQPYAYKAPLFNVWLLHIGTFLTLAYVVWKILKENQNLGNTKVLYLSIAAIVVLGLLSLEVNGLVLGVVLLLIGFAHSHRLLIGLGIFSSFAFLSYYYYYTGETLMAKSGLLAMLGIGLLISRFLMKYLLRKEVHHV